MGTFAELVDRTNADIAALGRWRRVAAVASGGVRTAHVDGAPLLQFASNDYLGLSQHPAVAAAARAAIDRYGTGSGASRLIVGGRPIHDELEVELADWKGAEAALLFPTGFAANLGVIAAAVGALGATETVVFSDELNHASIIDGIRLSRAETSIFGHRDLAELDRRLGERQRRNAMVVSDSVFSMDGDVADVSSLGALCLAHDAVLVLDEAHSVLGPASGQSDREVLDDLRRSGLDVVVVGTLSKALGSLGGFVAATRSFVDLCVNTARPFIFTTAPTPADAAAALEALRVCRGPEGDDRRDRLRRNVDSLVPAHPSPIVPVMLGTEARALEVSAALLERGLLVPAIRPPTVAEGTCRLRVALSASHEPSDVDRLRTALDDLDVTIGAGDASSITSVAASGSDG